MKRIQSIEEYRTLPSSDRIEWLTALRDLPYAIKKEGQLAECLDAKILGNKIEDRDTRVLAYNLAEELEDGHDLVQKLWSTPRKKVKVKQEVKSLKGNGQGRVGFGFRSYFPTRAVQDGVLSTLSPSAFTVWVFLTSTIWRSNNTANDLNRYLYSNYYKKGKLASYQSIRNIVDSVGKSSQTVLNAIKELEELGYLNRRTMPANLYYKRGMPTKRYIYELGFIRKDGKEQWYLEYIFNGLKEDTDDGAN